MLQDGLRKIYYQININVLNFIFKLRKIFIKRIVSLIRKSVNSRTVNTPEDRKGFFSL